MKNLLLGIAVAIIALLAVGAVVVAGGLYNIAADEEHTDLVYNLIETARERSIAVRASDIEVPDLNDPQRIRRGAGNYDSMCAGCHLRPGAEDTEISRGLYPRPPDLATAETSEPARAFWIIKHGIKATGMPAWGKSMEDAYIWDMVALIRRLPTMNAEQYAAEVAASEGHSHSGTQTMDEEGDHGEHSHDETTEAKKPATHEHSHESTTGKAPAHTGEHQTAQSSIGGDVIETVKAFHAALSSGDAAAVERVLDPNALIMEGGNVERSK